MQGNPQKKPKIGSVRQVEQQLYAKNVDIKEYQRYGFQENEESDTLATTWNEPTQSKKIQFLERRKKVGRTLTPFTKIFIISLLFFLFSAMAAVMVFYLNTNQVEYNAVRLAVLGPNSVAGGEELQFDISITNDNPVNLVLSDLIINYPRGTITADAEGSPLEKDVISIEEIRSGLSETVKFSAILFGSEGDTRDINIVFQYRVPDSDIIFFKERTYQVQLESAPVVLSVDHENRFQSGDEVSLNIEVSSNANKVLRNLFLSVDYPFGFEFASSTPAGLDQSSYALGNLEPGETYTLTIEGIIRGQDNEQRTIRYSLGSENRVRPGNLGTVFTTNESNLLVTQPPVGLSLQVNSSRDPIYVARPGQDLNVTLNYLNNLQTKLLDNVITVTLSGTGYDRVSVEPEGGFYRSINNTISWTQTDIPLLDELEPNQGDSVSFELEALSNQALAGLVQNPAFVLTARAEGTNFALGGEEKRVQHSIDTQVKLSTEVDIDAYLLYSSGPLTNRGPTEPVVGTVTTYTLVLQATNTTNRVEDVRVTARLPRYVSLRDIFVPADSNIAYDERSREITWAIKSLEPGIGHTRPAEEVFLSLSFEPSLQHLDSSPDLVEDIRIQASDVFAGVSVNNRTRNLDTQLTRDPAFDGRGTVKASAQ